MSRFPITTLALALAITGCSKKAAEREIPPPAPAAVDKAEPKPAVAAEPILPLPQTVDVNMDKVVLGRRLFHDGLLSSDGKVSCATCHTLDHGGAEPRKTSVGVKGQVGPINSPTVLNASFNIAQFWDGRAKDLQEQAAGPVANPIEMGETWDNVVKKVGKDKKYAKAFGALYPDGVTQDNITDAIAEYEKSLITPSRFDAYLRGDQAAITAEEKKGYADFKEAGCLACHVGVLAGGNMYQKMGLVRNYFAERGGEITEADLGRFNHTKNPVDKHFFKVPTLRNVELTSPYLHDGSQDTLEGTVKLMGRYQLGKELSDEQVASIVLFLKSLTGELPAHARMPKS